MSLQYISWSMKHISRQLAIMNTNTIAAIILTAMTIIIRLTHRVFLLIHRVIRDMKLTQLIYTRIMSYSHIL